MSWWMPSSAALWFPMAIYCTSNKHDPGWLMEVYVGLVLLPLLLGSAATAPLRIMGESQHWIVTVCDGALSIPLVLLGGLLAHSAQFFFLEYRRYWKHVKSAIGTGVGLEHPRLEVMRLSTYGLVYGTLAGFIAILSVIGYARLQQGGFGALVAIAIGIPFFLFYGASRTCLPQQSYVTCLCSVPCAIFLPGAFVYYIVKTEVEPENVQGGFFGTGRDTSDRSAAILTGMIGLPLAALSWSVLWRLRGMAEAGEVQGEAVEDAAPGAPQNSKLLMLSSAFCCLLVFFPMGVLLPIFSTVELPKAIAAEICVALALGALMFCVTLVSMILNMCLRALEASKTPPTSPVTTPSVPTPG